MRQQFGVETRQQVERDDGRPCAQVELENVAPLNRDQALHAVVARVGEGVLDALGIDVETACLAAVLLGRRHRDASVAAAEVPDHVLAGHLGQPQQRIDHLLWRWLIFDVGDRPFAGSAQVDRFEVTRPNVEAACDGPRTVGAGNNRLDSVGVLARRQRRRHEAAHRAPKTRVLTLDKQPGTLRQIDLDCDGLPILLSERTGRDQARKQAGRQNQVAPHVAERP